MVQTAEGGMQQITNMLQRGRELTVQAANHTNTGEDRLKIANEIDQLFNEINSMAERVEFNGMKLINGDLSPDTKIHLQVGANKNQSIQFGIGSLRVADLKLTTVHDKVSGDFFKEMSGSAINNLLSDFDVAINSVVDERAKLGAIQNRLDFTMRSLDISSENLSASESRIRDADMAREMMNLTKSNVLSSAATSMLAQANQAPQNLLQIIR
jgi:flagellin